MIAMTMVRCRFRLNPLKTDRGSSLPLFLAVSHDENVDNFSIYSLYVFYILFIFFKLKIEVKIDIIDISISNQIVRYLKTT